MGNSDRRPLSEGCVLDRMGAKIFEFSTLVNPVEVQFSCRVPDKASRQTIAKKRIHVAVDGHNTHCMC